MMYELKIEYRSLNCAKHEMNFCLIHLLTYSPKIDGASGTSPKSTEKAKGEKLKWQLEK